MVNMSRSRTLPEKDSTVLRRHFSEYFVNNPKEGITMSLPQALRFLRHDGLVGSDLHGPSSNVWVGKVTKVVESEVGIAVKVVVNKYG